MAHEPGQRSPKIRRPELGVPWGFTVLMVALVIGLAIFGSWGFATIGQ